MLFRCYQILRFLLLPILKYTLPLFSKDARKRLDFEQRNITEVNSLDHAEYGFEVSSEGELEQVRVIIQHLIDNGKTVEIVFCSESVEKNCLELQKKYSSQIRLYRLPILSYNPLSARSNVERWLTCKSFYMCRYDFFPELIHYGKKKANNFVLLSAAPKGFFDKNILERMYLKNVYKSFTKFIAVSNDLKQTINKITSSEDIRVYDFRINQIQKRIAQSSKKIIENYAYLPPLIDFIKSNENTIIYGSFWNHELNLFENKAFHQFNHIIVPHQLSPKYIEEIESFFNQKSIRVEVIDENESAENVTKLLSQNNETKRVFILNVKGILCELYQFTNYSYIGGGFGDSIHSVLEPFISESFVICGPKVKRSSEYDFINGSFPNRIKKVDSLEAILSSISFKVTPKEREEFAEYIDFQKTNFNEIITWTLT